LTINNPFISFEKGGKEGGEKIDKKLIFVANKNELIYVIRRSVEKRNIPRCVTTTFI